MLHTGVDVSYGGETGFNQAIELSAETLGNVKLVQEKKLIQKWFDEIAMDTGKYCFMLKDTLAALEQGAVETLLVWENLDAERFLLKMPSSDKEIVVFLTKEQQKNPKFFQDPETGVQLETVSQEPVRLAARRGAGLGRARTRRGAMPLRSG